MLRSFGINVQQKIKEKWVERSASASQGFYLTEGQSAEDKDNIILSQTFPFLEQQLPTLGNNKLWWKISLTVIFEDLGITMLLALIRAFNLKENIYYILRRPWSDLRSLPLYTMINKKEIKIRLGYMFLSQRTFSKFIDEGYFGSAGVKSFCRSSFLFEK